jgi:hypothetical protein
MHTFILHHQHRADECAAAFAAWNGFASPLRRHTAPSTCLAGGHAIWWIVHEASELAALALVPPYVRSRTRATEVRDVVIP